MLPQQGSSGSHIPPPIFQPISASNQLFNQTFHLPAFKFFTPIISNPLPGPSPPTSLHTPTPLPNGQVAPTRLPQPMQPGPSRAAGTSQSKKRGKY